jgi:hypothetical protein
MININGGYVGAREKPTPGDMKKLAKLKNAYQFEIFRSKDIGAAWAKHADAVHAANFQRLWVHHFGRPHDDFAWLKSFSFFSTVYLASDVLPQPGVLREFKQLREFGAGLQMKGPIKDAKDLSDCLRSLKKLGLCGRWKNCAALSGLKKLNTLSFSYFDCDQREFFAGMDVQKVVVHHFAHFPMQAISTLPKLKHLEFQTLPKGFAFPDLRAHPNLQKVVVQPSLPRSFDPKKHFSRRVKLEIAFDRVKF